jgi:hypothetical protein
MALAGPPKSIEQKRLEALIGFPGSPQNFFALIKADYKSQKLDLMFAPPGKRSAFGHLIKLACELNLEAIEILDTFAKNRLDLDWNPHDGKVGAFSRLINVTAVNLQKPHLSPQHKEATNKLLNLTLNILHIQGPRIVLTDVLCEASAFYCIVMLARCGYYQALLLVLSEPGFVYDFTELDTFAHTINACVHHNNAQEVLPHLPIMDSKFWNSTFNSWHDSQGVTNLMAVVWIINNNCPKAWGLLTKIAGLKDLNWDAMAHGGHLNECTPMQEILVHVRKGDPRAIALRDFLTRQNDLALRMAALNLQAQPAYAPAFAAAVSAAAVVPRGAPPAYEPPPAYEVSVAGQLPFEPAAPPRAVPPPLPPF